MDTLAARWAFLAPHVTVVGPNDDRPRPAVLIFHGCGGVRGHLPLYAAAAQAAGWRAFIIDSFAPRGWDRRFALSLVCTGIRLRGRERAGDVAAAIHGVSERPDVDPERLAIAGWSHGGWAIMELMSADLRRSGAVGLGDAARLSLTGVKAAWLAYPYIGVAAPRRMRPWRHCPRVIGVIARRDHLTTVHNARRVLKMVADCGAEVETWIADGAHAFDEPMSVPPMRHDPVLARESIGRFRSFLEDAAVAPDV